MTTFRPRVAVIGAGPAGLALSLLLHQRGLELTVYELRPMPTREELAKPPGSLDLHEEPGLKVMRECGLWDRFQKLTGDCAEVMRISNSDGAVLHTHKGRKGIRPEIARNALTDLLIQHIPYEVIVWDQKITSIQSTHNANSGAIELVLDLGANKTASYDFVVGADGAWS